MEKLSYILCCRKDRDDFALTFNADEIIPLKFKFYYFQKRGYTIHFYSLKEGVFELSDINLILEK